MEIRAYGERVAAIRASGVIGLTGELLEIADPDNIIAYC
jgi:hypothetical protein